MEMTSSSHECRSEPNEPVRTDIGRESRASANERGSAHTDTPSHDYYYAGEIPRVTGFSFADTVRLELLGLHPASLCDHHVFGPCWPKTKVDEFAKFLTGEPEHRQWLLSLLADAPGALVTANAQPEQRR